MSTFVDLGHLGFDEGAHIVVKHAIEQLEPGARVDICGTHPELRVHLRAWCRARGHGYEGRDADGAVARLTRGTAAGARLRNSEAAGHASLAVTGAIVDHPPRHWGVAPRGAQVELGGPDPFFALDEKAHVWADEVPRLYAQAAAAQWDPASAIDWDAAVVHDEFVEVAVVQAMTYLIENEVAALVVPARFIAQVHPHFREVVQLLAIQVADEARHIEVFTRRATLTGRPLGLSTVGGRQSLQTLIDEPDFAVSAFLLSVLGEGTFLSLLSFLETHAPDSITRRVAQLALQDEARHVAFGLAHLRHHLEAEPDLRGRLVAAVERRHDALAQTSGLNDEVFDSLVVLAAGSLDPAAVAYGWRRVQELQDDMDVSRRRRLARLGFAPAEAEAISALHTRNFM
ncbi:MAG: ferritin-like domain-containing protein [Actinobacteria bacterium]|nr:MAG: ferritin-like domain-containing protein [Actinomycetota bacterium]